jgi:hypothetical protein
MSSPTDDDPDLEQIDELFAAEEIALVEARAQVAWHERALAELAIAYPEVAALRPPLSEFTVADLRTEELKDALGRINAALKLTGDEEDYWLSLWDHARANLGVPEDEFDGMTREKLAEIIDAGLAGVLAQQPRKQWSRSRNPGTITLRETVREMKQPGLTQLQMCEQLDARKLKPPDLVGWRHLTWRKAYLSAKHGGAVKKWLSKATAVTP